MVSTWTGEHHYYSCWLSCCSTFDFWMLADGEWAAELCAIWKEMSAFVILELLEIACLQNIRVCEFTSGGRWGGDGTCKHSRFFLNRKLRGGTVFHVKSLRSQYLFNKGTNFRIPDQETVTSGCHCTSCSVCFRTLTMLRKGPASCQTLLPVPTPC